MSGSHGNCAVVDPRGHNSGRRCSFDESARRIRENSRWLAGGVSSNFRLGRAPTPLVFERGDGACLYDVDGNRLIDYYLGMGRMILGHNPEAVWCAAAAQLERGILYGGQIDLEVQVARRVCEMVPCAERMRFASSGSEVVQAAFRLARLATGRTKIVKFEGHYHGWIDYVLWSTAPAPLNRRRGRLAGAKGRRRMRDVTSTCCLETASTLCRSASRHGTILIFDEVITGFRLAPGGAPQRFGVTPDIVTFAKALANGFPLAAIAGRGEPTRPLR